MQTLNQGHQKFRGGGGGNGKLVTQIDSTDFTLHVCDPPLQATIDPVKQREIIQDTVEPCVNSNSVC